MFPYIVAVYLSRVPLIVDYWIRPQLSTIWVWLVMAIACFLAIYGAPKRNFANTFVPWNGVIINGIIAILCVL